MRAASSIAALVLLGACSTPLAQEGGVALTEFAIEAGSSRWRAGPVALRVHNEGGFPHTLVVTTDDGTVVATSPVLGPKEDTALELDLAPGTYQLTCRIVVQTDDGRVIDHYEEGMHATIRVGDG